jgi:hypothetical protein
MAKNNSDTMFEYSTLNAKVDNSLENKEVDLKNDNN